jgi:transcriptional regulator with XRE-family HTH domain
LRPTGEWLVQPGGLAEALRALRRAAGLTGDRLAEQLGWPRSKVPKLENGRQMPTAADITAWAQACGQPDAIGGLLDMLAEAETVHRQFRHQLRRGGHAAVQRDLDKLVRQAARIRNFEIILMPGLLQTPDYIRYRLQEAMRISGDDESRLEVAVAERIRRQEILYDTGREFEFILMETVLQARTCPDEVLVAQLDRLQGITGFVNVTLRLIPLDAELSAVPYCPFMVLDDLTYVETHASEELLRGEESAAYEQLADGLRAESVSGEAAQELITSASRRIQARIRRQR